MCSARHLVIISALRRLPLVVWHALVVAVVGVALGVVGVDACDDSLVAVVHVGAWDAYGLVVVLVHVGA